MCVPVCGTLVAPVAPSRKGANALYIGVWTPWHPFLRKIIYAPDLLVTVDSLHALYQGEKIDSLHTQYVDFSVCDKDSTKQFIVINTGTGTLKVNISSANAKPTS